MAVLFRLGFGLLLCPAADIADKAAAVDIAEAEAVIVDVHLFHHSNMIGNGYLVNENSLIRFIDWIFGVVHLSDFDHVLISDEHEQILLI